MSSWDTPLFADVPSDVLSSVLALIFVSFASAGSIGGGGLLVPLFLLVCNLGRFAIPLSKATIMGGAIANACIRWPARHPKADRPLIAFDVAVMLEPMTLIGTVIGVFLNATFPQWLITVLLVALLGYTANKTIAKARAAWAKEDKAIAARNADASKNAPLLPSADTEAAQNAANGGSSADGSGNDGAAPSSAQSEALSRLLAKERTAQPWMLATLFAAWLVMLVSTLLRGGHGAPPLFFPVACGSFLFWALPISACALLVLITFLAGRRLVAKHAQKAALGYKYLESDVRWEGKNLTELPLACTLAGVAAGLLGVGGAMVKGPLMLEMGVEPAVASATASFMILLTASFTTLQFVVSGLLRLDYTLWFALVGACGVCVGQSVVSALVHRFQRQSILVFALGINIGVSTCVMAVVGAAAIVRDARDGDWDAFAFNSLC